MSYGCRREPVMINLPKPLHHPAAHRRLLKLIVIDQWTIRPSIHGRGEDTTILSLLFEW